MYVSVKLPPVLKDSVSTALECPNLAYSQTTDSLMEKEPVSHHPDSLASGNGDSGPQDHAKCALSPKSGTAQVIPQDSYSG